MKGKCPGNMRRAEQADHGNVERGREMAWPRVRRHKQCRASDACLCQPDSQRLTRIGQASHVGMISPCHDLPGCGPLGRSAQHQRWHPRLDGEMACQGREVLCRPVLGRTECSSGIQAGDRLVPRQAELRPDKVGRMLIGRRCVKFGPY